MNDGLYLGIGCVRMLTAMTRTTHSSGEVRQLERNRQRILASISHPVIVPVAGAGPVRFTGNEMAGTDLGERGVVEALLAPPE